MKLGPEPEALNLNCVDVPIDKLRIMNERGINLTSNAGYRKIVASVGAIGLIEPLSVYAEGGAYVILDGYLRLMACKELGMSSVPCMVYSDKQAYTYNRNVNRLSAYQEIRMLRKSLETVDEVAIARTFGVKSIRARLIPNLVRQLHPDAIEAFKSGLIGKLVAQELMRVTHSRQTDILAEMRRMEDFGPAFCRALVIQSKESELNKSRRQGKAWMKDSERKKAMLARLDHAEKQHEFYVQLYRQYSSDLLKLTFYVRRLMSTPELEGFIRRGYPELAERFAAVVGEPQ